MEMNSICYIKSYQIAEFISKFLLSRKFDHKKYVTKRTDHETKKKQVF